MGKKKRTPQTQKVPQAQPPKRARQQKQLRKLKRTYKDSMFRAIFKEKKNLLSLYNAVNGTNHTNEDDLEINTLENVIYMNYKNDISFVINLHLYLYEHQSSINPNMPLRDLFYVTKILQEIMKDEDIYSSTLKTFPTPRFVVFYNGVEEKPDQWEVRLSDAFAQPTNNPELELIVTVLNINLGKNKKLMEACKVLYDYAVFIQRMRERSKTMTPEEAAEQTIEECIKEDILADFLKEHKAEAKDMCQCLYEYDEEKHIREECKIARETGWKEGWYGGWKGGEQHKLVSQVSKKLKKNHTVSEIADMLEEDTNVIQQIYNIAREFAPDYDEEKITKRLSE